MIRNKFFCQMSETVKSEKRSYRYILYYLTFSENFLTQKLKNRLAKDCVEASEGNDPKLSFLTSYF